MTYESLENWHSPEIIQHALRIARGAVRYSRKREEYFTEDWTEFMPHDWVVDAICCALKEDYND